MPNINNLDQEEITLGRQKETKEQKTDWEFAQALTRWYEIAGVPVDEQKKQEIKEAVEKVRARDGQNFFPQRRWTDLTLFSCIISLYEFISRDSGRIKC